MMEFENLLLRCIYTLIRNFAREDPDPEHWVTEREFYAKQEELLRDIKRAAALDASTPQEEAFSLAALDGLERYLDHQKERGGGSLERSRQIIIETQSILADGGHDQQRTTELMNLANTWTTAALAAGMQVAIAQHDFYDQGGI